MRRNITLSKKLMALFLMVSLVFATVAVTLVTGKSSEVDNSVLENSAVAPTATGNYEIKDYASFKAFFEQGADAKKQGYLTADIELPEPNKVPLRAGQTPSSSDIRQSGRVLWSGYSIDGSKGNGENYTISVTKNHGGFAQAERKQSGSSYDNAVGMIINEVQANAVMQNVDIEVGGKFYIDRDMINDETGKISNGTYIMGLAVGRNRGTMQNVNVRVKAGAVYSWKEEYNDADTCAAGGLVGENYGNMYNNSVVFESNTLLNLETNDYKLTDGYGWAYAGGAVGIQRGGQIYGTTVEYADTSAKVQAAVWCNDTEWGYPYAGGVVGRIEKGTCSGVYLPKPVYALLGGGFGNGSANLETEGRTQDNDGIVVGEDNPNNRFSGGVYLSPEQTNYTRAGFENDQSDVNKEHNQYKNVSVIDGREYDFKFVCSADNPKVSIQPKGYELGKNLHNNSIYWEYKNGENDTRLDLVNLRIRATNEGYIKAFDKGSRFSTDMEYISLTIGREYRAEIVFDDAVQANNFSGERDYDGSTNILKIRYMNENGTPGNVNDDIPLDPKNQPGIKPEDVLEIKNSYNGKPYVLNSREINNIARVWYSTASATYTVNPKEINSVSDKDFDITFSKEYDGTTDATYLFKGKTIIGSDTDTRVVKGEEIKLNVKNAYFNTPDVLTANNIIAEVEAASSNYKMVGNGAILQLNKDDHEKLGITPRQANVSISDTTVGLFDAGVGLNTERLVYGHKLNIVRQDDATYDASNKRIVFKNANAEDKNYVVEILINDNQSNLRTSNYNITYNFVNGDSTLVDGEKNKFTVKVLPLTLDDVPGVNVGANNVYNNTVVSKENKTTIIAKTVTSGVTVKGIRGMLGDREVFYTEAYTEKDSTQAKFEYVIKNRIDHIAVVTEKITYTVKAQTYINTSASTNANLAVTATYRDDNGKLISIPKEGGQVPYGSTVTFKAEYKGTDNKYVFDSWQQGRNNKIMSAGSEYSVYVTGAITIKAVYTEKKTTGIKNIKVVLLTGAGNLYSSDVVPYTNGQDPLDNADIQKLLENKPRAILYKTFTGWVLDNEATVLPGESNSGQYQIVFRPTFITDEKMRNMTVTVKVADKTFEYHRDFNNLITVDINNYKDIVDVDIFQGWKVNGQLLTTQDSYTFSVLDNYTLEAYIADVDDTNIHSNGAVIKHYNEGGKHYFAVTHDDNTYTKIGVVVWITGNTNSKINYVSTIKSEYNQFIITADIAKIFGDYKGSMTAQVYVDGGKVGDTITFNV